MAGKLAHVAVLIETSREYGRGLLRGVARYVEQHGPWSLYFRPHDLGAPPPLWLRVWRGDGILARIDTREMADAVLGTRLPAVDLRSALDGVGLPGIGPDNQAVVELGLGHLLDRGLRHFGFCGLPAGTNRYLDIRREHFIRLADHAGMSCDVFQSSEGPRTSATWEQEQDRITGWLKTLPKPVGIMADTDERGQQVLDACLRAGLQAPEQVAVVGINNDECLCRLSNPQLTSIDVNAERIGYEAAALLDRLMAGKTPSKEIRQLPPRGIISRRSTDMLAIEDPAVAASLQYIRKHACDGLSVEQLVRRLNVSRSTLERRFKKLVGRTPKMEILRVQLDRAKELLAYSDLPLPRIAQKSGFGTPSHFGETFRRQVGATPRKYRTQRGREAF